MNDHRPDPNHEHNLKDDTAFQEMKVFKYTLWSTLHLCSMARTTFLAAAIF